MNDKTKIETEHYDQKAAVRGDDPDKIGKSRVDMALQNAHDCFIAQIKTLQAEKKSGLILDYGCGTGYKTMFLADDNWKIMGIDISSVSIEFANKAVQKNNANAMYQVMDCEQMQFSDNSFDLVIDYGTFSSLSMEKAFPELLRVLKPDGSLVAIETFGHNPLTNFKRWLNVRSGRCTKWAASHIMKKDDWKKMAGSFSECTMYYRGFLVLMLVPVFSICPRWLMRSVEAADRLFLKIPFFKYFAFKTVVVLKNPKKPIM
ncbi:MAG TPA: methyltransferase domain-containing protein [Bacteroidales bacterium]|nr:methyltransferase domain-containing protein [Bacteroidales bacterium]HNZ43733.1 methyltransferase domain-containing protein [Bacteroidales bacterium]HOH84427.1 methyltransferase domain-containing protein [Bacteroidales bacterium]HPB24153.1 methyltransferase domain-containing protein [Bacteroidales bacterium]HPI29561.1 methyltransferase domain-containing protein [Bacteroidales bacterium]